MNKKNIIIALIAFTLGLLLSLNNCNNKPNTIIEYETVISHTRDTIYLEKEIYIKEDQSITRIDENNTYKDSTNKYYNQTFTDSNYVLNTYGGYVDSIDLTIKTNDIIIYDSIIKTTTITNTIYKPYKHSVSVDYLWNGNSNVILNYTRNFDRIGISIGTGININNKVPLMKVGLNYSF